MVRVVPASPQHPGAFPRPPGVCEVSRLTLRLPLQEKWISLLLCKVRMLFLLPLRWALGQVSPSFFAGRLQPVGLVDATTFGVHS